VAAAPDHEGGGAAALTQIAARDKLPRVPRSLRRLRPVGFAVALLLAGVLSSNLARGTPPPRAERGSPEPHGFVEPCTVGNVQEMHTQCELCTIEGASQTCQERFGARGYEKKCATRGGHAAPAEVWCLDQRAKKSAARNPGVLLALGISIALGVFVILKRARAKRPLK
jgi:hypothetical protein